MPNVNIDKRSEQTAEDAQVDENDWVLLDPDADHCAGREMLAEQFRNNLKSLQG